MRRHELIEKTLELIMGSRVKETDNPLERAIKIYVLERGLSLLWDMRTQRENEFGDLVNLLYLNLKHKRLLTRENISNKQLDAYYKIINQILRNIISRDEFNQALDILESHDIEPWALLADEVEKK